MFQGRITHTEQAISYISANVRTTLLEFYDKILQVQIKQVQYVPEMGAIAEVHAMTEHGPVRTQVQVDPAVYDLASRLTLDTIPDAVLC